MLAVADEEGYVSIFSTQKQLPNFVDTQFRTGAHSLCVSYSPVMGLLNHD